MKNYILGEEQRENTEGENFKFYLKKNACRHWCRWVGRVMKLGRTGKWPELIKRTRNQVNFGALVHWVHFFLSNLNLFNTLSKQNRDKSLAGTRTGY